MTLLLGQWLSALWFAQGSAALDVDALTGAIKTRPTRPLEPIKVDRKTQKLEDIIGRMDIPYGFPQMIPLQGINITGLGPKAILALGENYFVVRSNTSTIKMSDLYKDNRSAAKANYVTMDCIVHPYIAYTNRINADSSKRYLMPLMKILLAAMLKASMADYQQADDAEVRADIEGNIAFLALGLKLLDPSFLIPQLGRVPQMVHADYDSIVFAKPGHSSIFDRNEDFSVYKPTGWYRSSSELVTFYRVKTWLSRLSYPINDVTLADGEGQINNFRRSVLLYRSLDIARIDGKPAFETWTRLVKGMFILGSQVENWQEKNLYPHDYKATFKSNSTDLRMTLSALSEPLYRTKLLLAVRKQKPMSLGTTSIFDLEDEGAARDAVALFRLFPTVGAPEEAWMRWAAKYYPKPGLNTNLFPVALLDLNGWAIPQAANFLLDSAWAMDEHVPKAVLELKKWVSRKLLGGHVQAVENRIWGLMAPSTRLLPDGIQTAVRGEMWANRKMESAFCAFLDSQSSIAPPVAPLPKSAHSGAGHGSDSHHSSGIAINLQHTDPARKPVVLSVKPSVPIKASVSASAAAISGAAGKPPAPGQRRIKPLAAQRAARGHFLDPYPDFYQKLEQDAQRIDKDLTALGFPLEPALKRGLDDYVRLFQRFAKIAKDEIECKPVAPADLSLLANIDMILDKIDLPLPAIVPVHPQPVFPSTGRKAQTTEKPGVLTLSSGTSDQSTEKEAENSDPAAGFTMAIGRPGLMYIILQNKATHDWTLARGAVYTYYEQYGTTLTEEALLHKIDKGLIQPPYWTERFDFVQADTRVK